MLVLVIPQIKNLVFVLKLRLRIVPDILELFANKLCFCRSQEIQELLGQCSGRSWMEPLSTVIAACHLVKFYSSHLKMLCEHKRCNYCSSTISYNILETSSNFHVK